MFRPDQVQKGPLLLYIHWPFCPYVRHHDFLDIISTDTSLMTTYHNALMKEILNYSKKLNGRYDVSALYIGGGMPSTYPNALLLDMADILKEVFLLHQSTEMTIEVNPRIIHPEQLLVWKDAGVNRLSIGTNGLSNRYMVQSDSSNYVTEAFSMLKKASVAYNNLSVDIVLGIPGITVEQWRKYIKEIVSLPISHVALYIEDIDSCLDSDELLVLYDWASDYLHNHGFVRYELSYFARTAYESSYNVLRWNGLPYKGFGLGAHSFDGIYYSINHENMKKYVHASESGSGVTERVELWDKYSIIEAKIIHNLRRPRGVQWDEFETVFLPEQREEKRKDIVELVHQGFLQNNNRAFMLTSKGMMVENALLKYLLC